MSSFKSQSLKWLFVLATPYFLSGCERPSVEPKTRLQTVELLQLATSSTADALMFPAIAAAAERAHLSFLVSGEVTEVLVKEGDRVSKGDVIAKLDPRDFRIAVRNAEASYTAINSRYQRSKPLLEKGLLAQSEFDELSAKRQMAKVELDFARLYLEYTQLKSPIDGMISRVNVEQFESITLGQNIVNVHNIDEVDVLVKIPDRLFINKPSQQEIWQAKASVQSPSGQLFDATIKEFTTEPDPTSGTYTITLTLPMPQDELILDGMAVEAFKPKNISGMELGPVSSVPYQALINADGDTLIRDEKYVWVYDNNTVRKQKVTTGAITGNSVQVIAGLEGDEIIVVKGLSQLREGAEVKVTNMGAMQ
ncbi:efflux RND transporter periplasmic adaptor subunit [Vibrio superstes]|uniref:Hemolysin secretion protein D n=1 Tax=Vibrio superstes NBRC 103154 TaxID=1219062 RepID=A0A511QWI1_9VIBR|nr:efflux RND transporter periplasmic adaptor subunit [Vibrio superstes]GEM81734.1 hemolysin secretion protein D [Vibrio superstes NBRC 103154]